MELLAIIVMVLICIIIINTLQRRKSNGQFPTVEEWHQLGPASKRFHSKSLNSGYVYFVQESGYNRIKIGKAKNPEERIQNDFGTIMPYEFKLIHLIKSEDHHKTENLFHKYFDNKRYKGEWFTLTKKDLEWIKNECFPRDIEDSIKGY